MNALEQGAQSFVITTEEGLFALDRTTLMATEPFHQECSAPFIVSLGIYEIDNTNFLINVVNSTSETSNSDIHRIQQVDIIQITPGKINQDAISLLYRAFEFCPMFYGRDIWGVQGRRSEFVWNTVALDRMQQVWPTSRLSCLVECISGSVSVAGEFTIISRRAPARANAHFWVRGADSFGRTANFVETEQIWKSDTSTYSFLQVRGSMPFHWSESPTLAPLPPVSVDLSNAEHLFNSHIEHLGQMYGDVKCVNLCSATGRESEICALMNSMPGVIHFDYQALNPVWKDPQFGPLFEMIDPDQLEFCVIRDGVTAQRQRNIVRTNCMQCIDRTNVVQSLFGIEIARRTGQFDISHLRKCWQLNGDRLARMVTGTNALKSDVTLTGHATLSGLVADVSCALKRYRLDLTAHGTRQDALDCITQSTEVNLSRQRTPFLECLWLFVLCIFCIFSSPQHARSSFHEAQRALINHPRFRDLKDANTDSE